MPQRSPLTVTPLSLSPRTLSCDSSHTVGTFSTSRTVTSESSPSQICAAAKIRSDYDAIENTITEAKKSTNAPTIINMKTTIGYGSTQQGGHDVHGAREYISRVKGVF